MDPAVSSIDDPMKPANSANDVVPKPGRSNKRKKKSSKASGKDQSSKKAKFTYDVPHPKDKFKKIENNDSLLNAYMLSACLPLDSIEALFELHDAGKLEWLNGKNVVVGLLFHVAKCHDKLLSSNGRMPCDSVYDVIHTAVRTGWTDYEKSEAWRISESERQNLKERWLIDMNSSEKWAMTAPIVQGAIGLSLWTLVSYFPGLCFSAIGHNHGGKEESFNNRGMAILPPVFSKRLFTMLEKNGYIDSSIHLPVFWDTAAVCLSSNDSAMSIQSYCMKTKNPFRVMNFESCWHFEHAPPFWGLSSTLSWVKVSETPEMWGEFGAKRKAIRLDRKQICAEVERTLIIKTSEGFELTFPSLFGTGRCLAKCCSSHIASWKVCVNPMMQLFEDRADMKMVDGALAKVPGNGSSLDFGWHNYDFEEQTQFRKAGKAVTLLQNQKIHTDHRTTVERGLFETPHQLNQEHHRWSTVEEWTQAGNFVDVVLPPERTELGPLSFFGALLPDTSIWITPKGQRGRGCVRTQTGIGRFVAFGGQVIMLYNLFVPCDTLLQGGPRRRRKRQI